MIIQMIYTVVGASQYLAGVEYDLPDLQAQAYIDEGLAIIPLPDTPMSRVVVTQDNISVTLGGVIDSDKEYFIDGIIDMGTTQIVVPVGGLSMRGLNFDVSGLTSSEDNYIMFISETAIIGSGDFLMQNMFISVTGTASKVYGVYDATGNNAFELIRVNYIDCTSLGDMYNYRQGLENGTGRFGGSPSLTLHGTWQGGFRLTTSIVRQMSDITTEPLFKAGTAFLMTSRFLTDINCDLGDLQPFTDFALANFPNDSTVQFKGTLMTRGGISNSEDANITPFLTPNLISCDWDNNIGMPNTFIGGSVRTTAEIVTSIVTIGVAVPLAGTWVASDLQHFDSPSNGVLRHIGTDPKSYRISFGFSMEGTATETIKIQLLVNEVVAYEQIRVVNNLQGGSRDTSYFSGAANFNMQKNETVYWKVMNLSSSDDVTAEIDSQWIVEER
jgi:hypothetical protein